MSKLIDFILDLPGVYADYFSRAERIYMDHNIYKCTACQTIVIFGGGNKDIFLKDRPSLVYIGKGETNE